jgi:RNA polymerase sigma-70 factor (ECF subfamily)
MVAILKRYRIPLDDGEDLLQQAFLTFLRRRSEVEDPDAWLIGTMRNLALMYWRRERRRRDRPVDPPELESAAAALADSGERLPQEQLELQEDLGRYLSRLPRRHRSLLKMRFTLGYGVAEVADLLGRHPSNVSRGVHRGLAELSRLIEEEEERGARMVVGVG